MRDTCHTTPTRGPLPLAEIGDPVAQLLGGAQRGRWATAVLTGLGVDGTVGAASPTGGDGDDGVEFLAQARDLITGDLLPHLLLVDLRLTLALAFLLLTPATLGSLPAASAASTHLAISSRRLVLTRSAKSRNTALASASLLPKW